MPYDSDTGLYERRTTTVIDASPDGDTVYVAIDAKLDQATDDTVTDLNHHAANGNHYPATSTADDSRFLRQSPSGTVSWANGVVAADAALKDMSNVASGAIAPAKIAQDASNRFATDAEKTQWNAAQPNADITKEEIEAKLTGVITSHSHAFAPVGSLHLSTGAAALPATIPANGALISRTAYAALWTYAQASENIAASDGAWTKGQYSPGDGSTTFRVMDLRDQFVRGSSSTRVVGYGEEDEFKSHTHVERASGAGGALLAPTLTASGANDLATNLSTSATGGDETRPKNVAYLWCIKY